MFSLTPGEHTEARSSLWRPPSHLQSRTSLNWIIRGNLLSIRLHPPPHSLLLEVSPSSPRLPATELPGEEGRADASSFLMTNCGGKRCLPALRRAGRLEDAVSMRSAPARSGPAWQRCCRELPAKSGVNVRSSGIEQMK